MWGGGHEIINRGPRGRGTSTNLRKNAFSLNENEKFLIVLYFFALIYSLSFFNLIKGYVLLGEKG